MLKLHRFLSSPPVAAKHPGGFSLFRDSFDSSADALLGVWLAFVVWQIRLILVLAKPPGLLEVVCLRKKPRNVVTAPHTAVLRCLVVNIEVALRYPSSESLATLGRHTRPPFVVGPFEWLNCCVVHTQLLPRN